MKYFLSLILILPLGTVATALCDIESIAIPRSLRSDIKEALVDVASRGESCEQINQWLRNMVPLRGQGARTSRQADAVMASLGFIVKSSIVCEVSSTLYHLRREIGVGIGDLSSAWLSVLKKTESEIDEFIAAAVGYMHALNSYNKHHGEKMPKFPPSYVMRSLILIYAGRIQNSILPISRTDIPRIENFLKRLFNPVKRNRLMQWQWIWKTDLLKHYAKLVKTADNEDKELAGMLYVYAAMGYLGNEQNAETLEWASKLTWLPVMEPGSGTYNELLDFVKSRPGLK